MNSLRSAKAPAFAVLLFVVALAGLRALAPTTSARDPLGSQDFAAYWSAWDVTVDGGDPYDEVNLARSQAPLGLEALEEPQRWWNPPWALVVLGPVLLLPFDVATVSARDRCHDRRLSDVVEGGEAHANGWLDGFTGGVDAEDEMKSLPMARCDLASEKLR